MIMSAAVITPRTNSAGGALALGYWRILIVPWKLHCEHSPVLERHHTVLIAISRILRSLCRLMQVHLWCLRPCRRPGFSDRPTSGILISLYGGEAT